MAISRREILKYGVSYGTGVITFGNDSLAYDRALRSFPENTAYAAFKQALAACGALEEETGSPEANELGKPEGIEKNRKPKRVATDDEFHKVGKAGKSDEAGKPEGAGKAGKPKGADEAGRSDGAGKTGKPDGAAEAPARASVSPETENALTALLAFRAECSELALSTLYTDCAPLVAALREGCLPAAFDLETLDEHYRPLVAYLQRA